MTSIEKIVTVRYIQQLQPSDVIEAMKEWKL
jgi:hypothetical protein